jgi:hypothetical protein
MQGTSYMLLLMKEFPSQAVVHFCFVPCTMSIMLAARSNALFLKSLGASISFRKTLNTSIASSAGPPLPMGCEPVNRTFTLMPTAFPTTLK